MAQFVTVKGMAESMAALNDLPVKLANNIARSALRAGAAVIADEARRRVPVGMPSFTNASRYGGYMGALHDSIRIGTRVKGDTIIGYIKAGGTVINGAHVWYANLMEYTGSMPHTEAPSGKKALEFNGERPFNSVDHPGFIARPFMRPALMSKAADAIVAVSAKMKELIDKNGLNQPDNSDEGETAT